MTRRLQKPNQPISGLVRAAFYALVLSLSVGWMSGCMTAYKRSVGANTQTNFNRVFVSDFNLAWQSTLDALKSVRLDVTNREAGYLQTRWIDNTKEKNFKDGDGSTAPYMRAQYRFKVSVAKGVYRGKNAIKVTVQREQLASRDALDDFRPLESDTIEENTLLYRIGRIISVRSRLTKLEEQATKQAIKNAAAEDGSSVAPDASAPPTEAPASESPATKAPSDLPPSPESGGLEELSPPT
jgi:hypothetical protein